MYDDIKIKTDDKELINKILKNLIYYNIVFYYHNEPIELLTYYFDNLNYLFANMIKDDNNQLIFSVNFFVSNLKNFILSLKNHN